MYFPTHPRFCPLATSTSPGPVEDQKVINTKLNNHYTSGKKTWIQSGGAKMSKVRIMIGYHNGTSSIISSVAVPNSQGASPTVSTELTGFVSGRVPLPLVNSRRLLKRIEPMLPPEAIASLVRAFLLATRRIMRKGAITYALL